MIFNFASKYAIKKVLVNQQREWNWMQYISLWSMLPAQDDNKLVENINSIETQKVYISL
jgi:hypothetical protein